MNAKEWLIILSGGAGPAGVALGAAALGTAPFTAGVGIAAALAFLVGAGAAAKALHMPRPAARKAKESLGQAADAEDPR